MATKNKNVSKTKNFRIGRKVFVGVFVAIFGIFGFSLLSNDGLRNKLMSAIKNDTTTVMYTNSNNKTETLYAPTKIAKWKSNNEKVATVSNTGIVTIKGRGEATITGTTSTGKEYKYKIIGRTKVIMFIQASQGDKMQKGYATHTGKKYTFSITDNTLIYHDNPGCGICWLTSLKPLGNAGDSCGGGFTVKGGDLDTVPNAPKGESGITSGLKLIDKLYPDAKYVELYLFFGLSGNSLGSLSCNVGDNAAIITGNTIPDTEIKTKYTNSIELYYNAAKAFKDKVYSTKTYIASIYPIDYAEAKKNGKGDHWVTSTNKNSCAKNYVSNYKRYYANRVAEATINKSYNGKITYIDMFSEFIERKKDDSTNLDWKGSHQSFNTVDGQHMTAGEAKYGYDNTAERYAKKLFEKAGL